MDAEELGRDIAKHPPNFRLGHWDVRSECRQDIGERIAVILPGVSGQFACPGIETRNVRRHRQDLLPGAEFVQSLAEPLLEIFPGEVFRFTAAAVVEHGISYCCHGGNSGR